MLNVVKQELAKFNDNGVKYSKCFIWGTAEKSIGSAKWILENTPFELGGFIDNNKLNWGKSISIDENCKLICFSPVQIDFDSCCVICGMHLPTCLKVIGQLERDNAFPIETAIYFYRWNEIETIIDKLLDQTGRDKYLSLLYYRMTGDYSYMHKYYCPNHYFEPKPFQNGMFSLDNDIFVDCGAYCGDTVEAYISQCEGVFRRIYAFEPGERQFKAMESRCKRLSEEWAIESDQIRLIMAGVGEASYNAQIVSGVTDSMVSMRVSNDIGGGTECAIIKLDDVLEDGATFIKMDVEGYEIKALCGAQETIKKYKPRMAISIYHCVCDVIDIPLLISSFNPNYKMTLELHSNDDTDAVLYCWENESLGGDYPGWFSV